ncbi:3-keto-5-aminohexanoate cleavage protein [Roseibium sp. HPY-6]|uniref:3-keto-5-aminohexanoate cleavage protein n=1 Tax=Roseibium sp. HPY-6 TaxID=3229852 RepID=UPI00338E153A
MTELPKILVAPNGARRQKSDHPAIPLDNDALIADCIRCAEAGAGGVHAHIRDAQGRHSLDPDLYKDLLARLDQALPGWFVQVTSESAGRYSAADQRNLIEVLRPKSVSVAIREFIPDPDDLTKARQSYHRARENDVRIQHICYSQTDLNWLTQLIENGTIPGNTHQVQLVLGSYDGSRKSRAEDIEEFIDPMLALKGSHAFDWMLCAFGHQETECLLTALKLGGKARIGFENSLWNRDGSLAKNNAERVEELVSLAAAEGIGV